MSIIYDALQKTQKKLLSNQKKQIHKTPHSSLKNKKMPPFLVTITIALLVLLINFFTLKLTIRGNNLASHQVIKNPDLIYHQEQNAHTPLTSSALKFPNADTFQPSNEEMIVTGIIKLGEKRSAVINNEIFYEGDQIHGKKILSISSTQVEILHNGTALFLQLKR